MKQKKSQSGINAAVLVAIIAGMIILYIIFLPNSERNSLIGKKPTTTTNGGADLPSNTLLLVNPGTLSTSKGLEDEKPIPNIFLVETTNAKELESINPFIVANGWFDKKTKTVDFALDDPANTENAVLSFTAKKRQGMLTIKLNNEAVFENELASGNTEPIKLSKRLLGKSNTLEFSVSSVGGKFWSKNEYDLENVKIIGDITDTSRQESTNVFSITDSEYASMSKATLRFIPYCGNVNDIGTLDIFINNRKLVSSVPKCDDQYNQPIPKGMLNSGENNIVFKTAKGSYSVEQIKIALDFKEPVVKTYYFQADANTFSSIRANSNKITLTIKFVDDGKQKSAKLDVNGKAETIETSKAAFTKDITGKIAQGNNYIRLEPLNDLEVVEIKVELT